MAYYIGVDGGGTKTTCAVGDGQRVLATVTAGGSNVMKLGEEAARANLQSGLRQVCAAAGVGPQEVSAVCVGAAGAAAEFVRTALAAAVREVIGARVRVVGDMEIAMHAAFGDGPGVMVIAGTGSIAFGRNARGETARAGGWGWAVSDEGSGQWIGRRSVATIMRMMDVGRRTKLEPLLMQAWECSGRDDLVRKANSMPLPDFAALTPVVIAAEQQGDELAIWVLERAGVELAELATVVVQKLWLPGTEVAIATAGGVFAHATRVRHAFNDTLRMRCEDVKFSIAEDVVQPVLGALAMAQMK